MIVLAHTVTHVAGRIMCTGSIIAMDILITVMGINKFVIILLDVTILCLAGALGLLFVGGSGGFASSRVLLDAVL